MEHWSTLLVLAASCQMVTASGSCTDGSSPSPEACQGWAEEMSGFTQDYEYQVQCAKTLKERCGAQLVIEGTAALAEIKVTLQGQTYKLVVDRNLIAGILDGGSSTTPVLSAPNSGMDADNNMGYAMGMSARNSHPAMEMPAHSPQPSYAPSALDGVATQQEHRVSLPETFQQDQVPVASFPQHPSPLPAMGEHAHHTESQFEKDAWAEVDAQTKHPNPHPFQQDQFPVVASDQYTQQRAPVEAMTTYDSFGAGDQHRPFTADSQTTPALGQFVQSSIPPAEHPGYHPQSDGMSY